MDRKRTPTKDDAPGEAARAPEGHATFLAEASRLLAASLDYETTLATVAGMALPHLGAWCFVDLREPEGEMRRLAVIHPDPEMQSLARRLTSDWPPERDDPFGVPRAVRTRQSEVIEAVPDEMLVRAARSEANLRVLRRLGIGSLLVVPLIARDQVLGAITYVSPRRERGYGPADLALAEDLAARCAIAIDNARLYREARRARAEAEEASRAKSRFLATMSHEIRTPINAVIGYVDLLEAGIAGALTAEQARYLERIKTSNRHLLGLIDDVLDLARVDADRIRIHPEESEAGPVVDAALDLVRPQVEGRALALSESCEGDPEARFVADVDRVRQIVVNLLSNAVKFTGDGGRIRVSCGRAKEPGGARLAPEERPWTCIRVEDTGIGIEPDVLDRLFEPFVQAESGYTRSRAGSGLGLAISRRLARAMGGDLTVDSRVGEGSTFTLWLPGPAREATPAPREAREEPALRDEERVRGVAPVGEWILSRADDVAAAFAARLKAASPLPRVDEIGGPALKDHTTSLLADLAQSLVLLEESPDAAAELLRDGSAIQRTIADRHGLQRHRIGWTAEALDEEFRILREEVERAVREAAREHPGADAERALGLLDGFVQQARRGSLRAFRIAERGGNDS